MLYVFLYISELLLSVKILLSESYIRRARRVSHQFKAECQRDNIASLRSAFIMVSQNSLYMQAVRLVCEAPSVPPHPVSKFKTLVSCVKFFVGFLCVVHVLGLRRGGGRWWWQPISFPYTSVSLFSQGVFGDVPSGPSLCSHSSRFATLGRGGSGDFRGVLPLCPLSLGSLSHCRAVASPSPVFFGGGGGERPYYIHLLLCTAVTLTIELVYKVTVGRHFTGVLDGFGGLIYVGLGG